MEKSKSDKVVLCPGCNAEMKKGKVTKSQVMKYTEYICPNGCMVDSVAEPLPGHEPMSVEEKALARVGPAPEPVESVEHVEMEVQDGC